MNERGCWRGAFIDSDQTAPGNPTAVELTMNDADCTAFLQWALPKRELRWPGFRKVRRQVCKRLKRRIRDLGLDGYGAYGLRLETDATEWPVFDDLLPRHDFSLLPRS